MERSETIIRRTESDPKFSFTKMTFEVHKSLGEGETVAVSIIRNFYLRRTTPREKKIRVAIWWRKQEKHKLWRRWKQRWKKLMSAQKYSDTHFYQLHKNSHNNYTHSPKIDFLMINKIYLIFVNPVFIAIV